MKKKRVNKFYFTGIFLVAFFIGIGYALLNNTLNVFGRVGFASNKWDVHFENLVISDGSITNSRALIDENKTSINFSSALEKPGDFFEFYTDIVNDGTINAKVSSVINTGLSDSQKKYLRYIITYSDDNPIVEGEVLTHGDKRRVKVRLEYRTDITADDLPVENSSIDLTFSINYLQAD